MMRTETNDVKEEKKDDMNRISNNMTVRSFLKEKAIANTSVRTLRTVSTSPTDCKFVRNGRKNTCIPIF